MTDQSANAYWRMGGITVPEVEDYLYAMLPPRDEVLAEMEADASKNDVPIVGPAVARVLYQLATISGAKKIFEMGSAIGYSTIWWARAVGDGGRVIYTDGDQSAPIKPAATSIERASASASRFAWATRSNFFRRRRNNTTLSSTISIRPTTRASFVWRFRG